MKELALVSFGGLLTVSFLVLLPDRVRMRLAKQNFRGKRVPAVSGVAIGGSVLVLIAASALWDALNAETWHWRSYLLYTAPLLPLAAGIADDLVSGGPRGIRAHLRELRRGRLTTGMLKAAAAAVGGVLVVVAVPRGALLGVAGVLLMAGSANVSNSFDVVPGRSIKAFIVGSLAVSTLPLDVLFLLTFGGALAALGFDLGERAMLGDAGANLLGFVLGLVLYAAGPPWAIVVGGVLVCILNLIAETLTLSRYVRGFPPLRWIDDLGRMRPVEAPTGNHGFEA